MSSQSSGSNNHTNGNEDEPFYTYGSSLYRWIDRSCDYPFRHDFRDDQSCNRSFHQDFLPPTHLYEFHFMIDYMSKYSHDYYVPNLSLLYCMIKHRGRYLDEMMNIWLHWLYDFT
jgi:hypothetical protein